MPCCSSLSYSIRDTPKIVSNGWRHSRALLQRVGIHSRCIYVVADSDAERTKMEQMRKMREQEIPLILRRIDNLRARWRQRCILWRHARIWKLVRDKDIRRCALFWIDESAFGFGLQGFLNFEFSRQVSARVRRPGYINIFKGWVCCWYFDFECEKRANGVNF